MKAMINTLASLSIGLLVASYLYATYAGWSLPLSNNPRTAFIAFAVAGMAFCSVGIGHGQATVGFANPMMLMGIGFGIINLYIVYVALTGQQFMFVTDYTSATMALGGMMILKVITKLAMNLIYLR